MDPKGLYGEACLVMRSAERSEPRRVRRYVEYDREGGGGWVGVRQNET